MSRQTRKGLAPTKQPFGIQKNTFNQLNNALKNHSQKMFRKTRSLCNRNEDFFQRLSNTQQLNSRKNHSQSINQTNIHGEYRANAKSFDQINNKIENILNIYDYSKKQKRSQVDRRQKKQFQKEKARKCKAEFQNYENNKAEQQKNKSRCIKICKNSNQIVKKSLQDITILHINCPNKLTGNQNANQIKKKQSLSNINCSHLQIPKTPKAPKNNPSKKVQQKANIKINKSLSQIENTNCILQPITLASELLELQNSQDNINQILSNLQRDFLPPKNTDYFVFSQQEIKMPKIFKKNKANNFMYKSFTQTKISKETCPQSYKSMLIQKNTVRKSSRAQSHSLIQKQMRSFLMGLKTQIYLDSQFKKIKRWFLYNKNEDKWKLLEKQLRIHKLWVNQLTMKVIFMHQNQQGNPFQSIDDQTYSVKQFVLSFIAAQQHWNEYILQKFDDKLLAGAGLNQNTLDSSKKGYISIEDLIRFLHCKLKEFYYTRDLSMIYLRLKGGQKLQFQQLVSKISKKAS